MNQKWSISSLINALPVNEAMDYLKNKYQQQDEETKKQFYRDGQGSTLLTQAPTTEWGKAAQDMLDKYRRILVEKTGSIGNEQTKPFLEGAAKFALGDPQKIEMERQIERQGTPQQKQDLDWERTKQLSSAVAGMAEPMKQVGSGVVQKAAGISDDLLEQAKKYKSAEEFVKSQNPHTTDKSLMLDTAKHRNMDGMSLSDSKAMNMIKDTYSDKKGLLNDMLSNIDQKNGTVNIFRISPRKNILPGDFVRIEPGSIKAFYADRYPGQEIKKFSVPAKDVQMLLNDEGLIQGFAYRPNGMKSLEEVWNKANKSK